MRKASKKKAKKTGSSNQAAESAKHTSPLNSEDLKRLHSFHIPDKMIEAAGISRVNTDQARALGVRFGEANTDLSGRIYPYLDEDGEIVNLRLRRDNPERDTKGRPQNKYVSLSGRTRILYWAPGTRDLLKEEDAEIALVEAETSALAGAAYAKRSGRKLAFAAMGGCSGWHDKQTGTLRDLVLLRGRKVHIMLDSNVQTNEAVQKAESELAFHLVSEIQAREVKCYRLPAEINGPDDYLARYKDLDFKRLFDWPVEPWLDRVGERYEDYIAAKPPLFLIRDFLQSEGATFIGGLSGHGKTFIMLSIVLSLLTGQALFGHFKVLEKAKRVIYLTPEITLGAFKRRAELFNLGPFIKSRQLIIRTLTAYPLISLDDPALLLSAKGADVFLDPAIRFMQGDESSSSDNDRGLAAAIFHLLQRGARCVIATHHSPKSFEKADYMALENILRGSGDIGAMLSSAWGVRLVDRTSTLVHIENIKPRDFDPPPPFQIEGHPHINEGRGFRMKVKPGECGTLREYVKKKGGRPRSPERAERMAVLTQLVTEGKTREEVTSELKAKGLKVPKQATLKTEMSEARQLTKPKKFSTSSA